ncbi:hypothetical protein Acid345_3978 [Candidatus Koribacter versatilis Ellin345]|uniref:Uncharacterized protein n=1 Tax=Koribacter versatilis (strain Ellin345) TaxID=204669 RepID=Q1IJH2_KORVE|nr:hypothetical protein [Candidatus Koribacter versatilis]ABF42978.1 hypothetical protein Acid345_3978 [Candidatus Koribacter versatilis Ellin345]
MANAVDKMVRTVITFASSRFNTTDPKPYFINECCFGDDIANWLIGELRNRGVQVDETPGQEDFGWYINFKVADTGHSFVIGNRPDEPMPTWIGWVERTPGPLATLFGGRHRGITAEAVTLIHRILASDPSVCDLRWHLKSDFDAGQEDGGATQPT